MSFPASYRVAQFSELPPLSGPGAAVKQRLLSEFLGNPFLDDDLQGLALRLGLSKTELEEVVSELCRGPFLKNAGQRGYMLDLEQAFEGAATAGEQEPAPQKKKSVLLKAGESSLERLVESLPLGVILLRPDGTPELANERAVAWLGKSAEDLNADTFARITGFSPSLALEGDMPVSFSLKDPFALEVEMQPCRLAAEPGILIVLRDASVEEEVAKVHAEIQEELFFKMRREIVEPLLQVRRFLESSDARGLGQARAALEQVNKFLEDFLLLAKPESDNPDGGGAR